jgi:hypothetical protein
VTQQPRADAALAGPVDKWWDEALLTATPHRQFGEASVKVTQPALCQLVRQFGAVTDRTCDITCLAPGVRVYAVILG